MAFGRALSSMELSYHPEFHDKHPTFLQCFVQRSRPASHSPIGPSTVDSWCFLALTLILWRTLQKPYLYYPYHQTWLRSSSWNLFDSRTNFREYFQFANCGACDRMIAIIPLRVWSYWRSYFQRMVLNPDGLASLPRERPIVKHCCQTTLQRRLQIRHHRRHSLAIVSVNFLRANGELSPVSIADCIVGPIN